MAHTLVLSDQNPSPPIVIIGAGIIGMHTARRLKQLLPSQPIIVYGSSLHRLYHPQQLTDIPGCGDYWQQQLNLQPLPRGIEHRDIPVLSINPTRQNITDANKLQQPYSRLIFATGSSPYLPDIEGNGLSGVFVLRNLDDAVRLNAWRQQSRHAVVMGADLPAIETALALQRSSTRVTLIAVSNRLLPELLDHTASQLIQQQLKMAGIQIFQQQDITEIEGEHQVSGITLRSGRKIRCDSVIISAGIRPNIELAQQIRLTTQRGICINQQLQTSNPHIYAIGECAEYQGKITSLLAPCLEQADMLADIIAQQNKRYLGSTVACQRQLAGLPLLSLGDVNIPASAHHIKHYVYHDNHHYRVIAVTQGRLSGALMLGEYTQQKRLQQYFVEQRRIFPWQSWLFKQQGKL